MADKFYKPSKNKNKNTTTVRFIGTEPAWLAEIRLTQKLDKKLAEKSENVRPCHESPGGIT